MTASVTIVWLITGLILSLFFSGMEVAFVSSDKLKDADSKNSSGGLFSMRNAVYGHPRQFLATLLVGKVMTLVLVVSLAFLLLQDRMLFDGHVGLWPFLLFSLTLIFLLLLTDQFLPRMLFRKNANFWMRVCMIPLFLFYVLFYPVACFFSSLAKWIVKLPGARSPEPDNKSFTRLDLDAFVKKSIHDLAKEEDADAEVKIFRNALDFTALKVKDCMVPRAEIVAVRFDTDPDTLKEKFIETGLSRILVFNEDIDNIVGYIHIWEIFNQTGDWTASVAPISFVPESMSARQLMSDLMQQHKSIAVVVDEFGGTSGIVTMEDLVEEIFGEIEDEYDVKSNFIKQEGEHAFVLSGRVEIDHLNELYHLDLPESDAYSTVAGYLLHYTQRFPKTYETVIIGKYTFKILKVTARKIEVVRLQIGETADRG
ncbi:MAG: hemolysin family protein [Proteiniphilum sp.]|nr:hemolysin family protein [Proteiniphilum sp.]MDD4799563.1 hemolysin family protein [Proteiniphilum sp.]